MGSRIVFNSEEALVVPAEPEKVIETLKNGWAQLNRGTNEEPDFWVWVNESRVAYVEAFPDDLPPLVG